MNEGVAPSNGQPSTLKESLSATINELCIQNQQFAKMQESWSVLFTQYIHWHLSYQFQLKSRRELQEILAQLDTIMRKLHINVGTSSSTPTCPHSPGPEQSDNFAVAPEVGPAAATRNLHDFILSFRNHIEDPRLTDALLGVTQEEFLSLQGHLIVRKVVQIVCSGVQSRLLSSSCL